jgi:error-prone DNA polymerase
VRVAGLVIVRQSPPTAKGVLFVTLEDEDGMINVIVRPEVYKRAQSIWRGAALLIVEGTVQQREGMVDVLALAGRPLAAAFSTSDERQV